MFICKTTTFWMIVLAGDAKQPLNGSLWSAGTYTDSFGPFCDRGDFVFMTARNMGPGLVRAENISSFQ